MNDPDQDPDHDVVAKIGDIAAAAGLRRIAILAWRDLDDPEAGGSEVHASRIASIWGEAGIEVTMRTSYAPGRPQVSWRDGYRVIRKAGRYMVFPRAAFSEMMGWHGASDGLVEIWNGMPFFSPLWARRPTRHVAAPRARHDVGDDAAAAARAARAHDGVPRGAAALPPHADRHAVGVVEAPSSSSGLGFAPGDVHVVPPGVDARFSPGGAKSTTPLVVAVGRLVPVKRFHVLLDALATCRERHPQLQAVIVGEGYEREHLEHVRRELGADDWVSLPGSVSDAELLDLYRRAWVVASASAHEGWGMTLTEAAACGTPAVATRIPGHEDAVGDGRSGILVDDAARVRRRARSGPRRRRPARAARRRRAATRAAELTWGATARGTLEVLAAEAIRRRV